MTRTHLAAAAALALLGWSMGAVNAQPASIPVQGSLSDSEGVPIEGDYSIRFALYASQSGGESIFDETQSVNVEAGLFVAYLGDSTSIDLTIFDGTRVGWSGQMRVFKSE